MSSVDLRWAARHPLRWARHVWWTLLLAALLAVKAIVISADVWDVTALSGWWPWILGALAALVLVSAMLLHARRLQEATRAALAVVSLWRGLTYLLIWWASDPYQAESPLAAAFALHWGIVLLVALRWDELTVRASMAVTAEAGQECTHGGA